MQTFFPEKNLIKNFKCLDYRRLGKQRVEAMQIYNILIGKETKKKGWIHHTAVLMWKGYENFLALYHNMCIYEWIYRGYNNNMKILNWECDDFKIPWWYGNENFHSSHRQTLLSKKYDWYKQFGWKESPKYEYWWPTKNINQTSLIFGK